jgi:hypothetical protein
MFSGKVMFLPSEIIYQKMSQRNKLPGKDIKILLSGLRVYGSGKKME